MSKKLSIGVIVVLLLAIIVGVYIFQKYTVKKEETKVYRIGVLWTGGDFFSDIFSSFKEKMAELGYIENQNVIYNVYKAPLPVGNEEAVQKFIDEKVDLIFSFATEASIEAKKVATGTGIPVVFTCSFVEETGLIESVGHPGDNITGVRYPTTESAVGRLEYLKQIAPHIKRVWVPYLKDYPTTQPQIREIKKTAQNLGITIIEGAYSTPEEVKTYLNSLTGASDFGMDAILMMAEPFSINFEVIDAVFGFGHKNQLPISSAMVLNESYGPILGFHPTNVKFGTLGALQVDKVLKGIPAGTIPVLTADNDLRINYKYIQELGLNVDEELLGMAIEIVK